MRQRKQKKEEEQRKWEVCKFVEVLKVIKMEYRSEVGIVVIIRAETIRDFALAIKA